MPKPSHVVLIGLGGAVGATLRWAVAEWLGTGGFPVDTFAVNIAGCVVLAAVTRLAVPRTVSSAIGIGFCGGLTTFSTFAVETVVLGQDDRAGLALAYVAASVVVGIAAFVLTRLTLNAVTPERLVAPGVAGEGGR